MAPLACSHQVSVDLSVIPQVSFAVALSLQASIEGDGCCCQSPGFSLAVVFSSQSLLALAITPVALFSYDWLCKIFSFSSGFLLVAGYNVSGYQSAAILALALILQASLTLGVGSLNLRCCLLCC